MKPHLSILLVADHQSDPGKLLEGMLADLAKASQPTSVEILLVVDVSSANAAEVRLLFQALSSELNTAQLRLFEADLAQLGSAQFVHSALSVAHGEYLTVLPPGAVCSTPQLLSLTLDGIATYERCMVSVPCYSLSAEVLAQDLAGYSGLINADFPPYARDGYLCSRGLSCVYFAPRSMWLTTGYFTEPGNAGSCSVHQLLLATYGSLLETAPECLLLAGEAVFFAPGCLPEPALDSSLSSDLLASPIRHHEVDSNVTLFGSFAAEAMQLLGTSCARMDGRDFER